MRLLGILCILKIGSYVNIMGKSYTDKKILILFLLNQIMHIYRVSQEERAKLREGVPHVKLYRYNPKHLYPKLNGYGDNGKRILKL